MMRDVDFYDVPRDIRPGEVYRVRIANDSPERCSVVHFERYTRNPDEGSRKIAVGTEMLGGYIIVRDGTVVVAPPGAERMQCFSLDKPPRRPHLLSETEAKLREHFPDREISPSTSFYDTAASPIAGNPIIVRELGRIPTMPGEWSNFNLPTIGVLRTMHDDAPPGCSFTLADGVFAIAFYDDEGRELSRITEHDLPTQDGPLKSPLAAVEARWLLFKPGSERVPELRESIG